MADKTDAEVKLAAQMKAAEEAYDAFTKVMDRQEEGYFQMGEGNEFDPERAAAGNIGYLIMVNDLRRLVGQRSEVNPDKLRDILAKMEQVAALVDVGADSATEAPLRAFPYTRWSAVIISDAWRYHAVMLRRILTQGGIL